MIGFSTLACPGQDVAEATDQLAARQVLVDENPHTEDVAAPRAAIAFSRSSAMTRSRWVAR
jgi:hypothetical protein